MAIGIAEMVALLAKRGNTVQVNGECVEILLYPTRSGEPGKWHPVRTLADLLDAIGAG